MLAPIAPTFHTGASGLPIGQPHQRLVADDTVAADCVGLPPGARGPLQGERCVNSAWNGLKRHECGCKHVPDINVDVGIGRRR